MIGIATIRMVKAALELPGAGVAEQLATLALDGTDARPEALARILDPTADDEAVTQRGVPDWPVLVVTAEQPSIVNVADITGRHFDAPSVLVGVAYATRDTADAAQAWRDTDYTLNAVALTLNTNLFAADKGAARRRGSVVIVKCNAMTWGPVGVDVPGGKVHGALLLDLYVRMTRP